MSAFWVDSDHPYGAPDSNYYANGYQNAEWHHEFETWDEFMSEMGKLDEDYNYLYRWDFYVPDKRWAEPDEREYLEFCFVLQRKGTFLWARIYEPKLEDEEKIRAYLQEKWEYVKRLWEPLAS